jgi:hypothetical protein
METDVEKLNRLEARLAIEALNCDFCHFLDGNMLDELVELFTEDARYSHGLRLSSGRDEIRRLFTGRIKSGVRTSRHMQTGLKITLHNSAEAEGKSVCLTFACDGPPPVTPATPFLVADFIDEYQCGADGRWRIRKRHIERIFTAEGNSGPVGSGNQQ